MNVRGTKRKLSCAVSEWNISELYRKGLEVMYRLGPVSIDLGAIGWEVLYMG